MLCATGAVACLASFTVQWSGELPVQRSPWEQKLFGDLSTPAAPGPPTPRQAAAVSPKLEPTSNGPSHSEPVPMVDVPELTAVPSAALEVLPATSDLSAAEVSPRIIQPVRYQQRGASPTAWLSGGIELLDEASPSTSQPGTRYFPQAHRDAARHQDLCR